MKPYAPINIELIFPNFKKSEDIQFYTKIDHGYVQYHVGERLICLDGNFTKDELREIADFLEKHAIEND